MGIGMTCASGQEITGAPLAQLAQKVGLRQCASAYPLKGVSSTGAHRRILTDRRATGAGYPA